MAAAVALSNRALSTSGDYQKYFYDKRGRRQCHIFDPATGRPVQQRAGGVSVTAPDSMTADALGTILFVLGPEKGMSFIESRTNCAAMFIVRKPDGRFHKVVSSRFSALTHCRP